MFGFGKPEDPIYKQLKAMGRPWIMTSQTGAIFEGVDIFNVLGRGIVITGLVKVGLINLEDKLQVVGSDGMMIELQVMAFEKFQTTLDQANAGDQVGILVAGTLNMQGIQ